MKRNLLWMVAAVALLAAVAAYVFVGAGNPVRLMHAIIGGAESIAFAPPRVTVAGPSGPPQPRVSPGEAGIDPAALAAAVEYADKRNTRALVVGRGGHIVFEKYWGDASADSALDASGFTPVLAALMTGVALSDRAVTSLDAPVSRYIAQWENEPRGAITLRQLLAGDSGLAPARGRPWPRSPAARYHAGDDLDSILRAWPLAAGQRPGDAPADVDADVLALALAQAYRQPYLLALSERLWRPLDAGDFSVGTDGAGAAAHVRAGCCLRARIGDWMRVGELLANDGVFEGNQLMPPRFVAMLLSPTHAESPLGFFTRVDGTFATHGVARLEAAGKQRLWIVPSLKLAILRAGDEPPPDQGWDEAMIPDSIIRGTSGWQPAGEAGDSKIDPNRFAPH